MARSPARRRRAPARRGRKLRRAPRRNVNKKAGIKPMKQFATIVESVELQDLKSDTPSQAVFYLSQFFRATTIAKNFQFYRAAKVKWEYQPLYNTFQQGNSTAVVSKPQFYFLMNRDQNPQWSVLSPGAALFNMQTCGADPVSFTNNKEIIYKPNWCSPGINALTFSPVQSTTPGIAVDVVTNVISLGLKKQFSWLPTPDIDAYDYPSQYNPTTAPSSSTATMNTGPIANAGVVYNGHNVYIEQINEPNVPVCKVLCTVEWQFKGPKNNYNKEAPPS